MGRWNEAGWAGQVASAALGAYASMPRTGKPQNEERTALAVVLAHDAASNALQPVAVGTGTKCLGSLEERGGAGDRVADAHAEVLARRALVRCLVDDARRVLHEGKAGELVARDDNDATRCVVRPDVTLHLYVSCLPCGDASVIAPNTDAAPLATTGAKPLTGSAAPPPQAGAVERRDAPAALGAVRRKPGRGSATHCMSCSDKLCKWALLGVQGSLALSVLSRPVYLSSIVAHAAPDVADAAAASLRRAVADRAALRAHALAEPFAFRAPVCLAAPSPVPPPSVIVGDAALGTAPAGVLTPAPAAPGQRGADGARMPKLCGQSINWSRPNTHEVTIGARGVRAGSGKLASGQEVPERLRSRLCKASFARAVAAAAVRSAGAAAAPTLLGKRKAGGDGGGGGGGGGVLTYGRWKRTACEASATYHRCWHLVREGPGDGGATNPFAAWLVKPAWLEAFAVDGAREGHS